MKNFKYIFFFSLFFNFVNIAEAVFVDGHPLASFYEETSAAPRTSVLVKTEGRKEDQPSLKVKWQKYSPKKKKQLAAVTTDNLPKIPSPKVRLKRASSTRDTTSDMLDSSPEENVVAPAAAGKREVAKGHRRTRAMSSTGKNPLHKEEPLGDKRQLEDGRPTGRKMSLKDFTAGSDATIRNISFSLAELGGSADESSPLSPLMIPLFPSADPSNLEANNGVMTFNKAGSLQRQYFMGMKVDNYIEFLFTGLCQLRVYPADPESALILYSGHFDPTHSKFEVKFRNVGKVQVLPPEEIKLFSNGNGKL